MKTTAQEIMSVELLTVQDGDSLEDALKILLNNKITGLPVVDKNNDLVGVVSEYDIMVQVSAMAKSKKADLSVPFKYSASVTSVLNSASLDEIVDIFIQKKYRRLLVVDDGKKPIGIITRSDIMKVFYYRSRLT